MGHLIIICLMNVRLLNKIQPHADSDPRANTSHG